MARRLEDIGPGWVREVEEEEEDWQPSPELRAELEADIAAFKRGELETVSWEEFRPVLRRMIVECERLAAEAEGDGGA